MNPMNPPNRSIVYRVSRSGHVMGEYDIDRIVELLDSGEFLWTDLCWAQGMAGWAPLSNLRAEVAAAKAFPPVAAMPVPVASGRRRMQAPSSQMSAPQTNTPSVAGWMWIVGGVTLGALVGLLTTQLFPNTVLVDRPVEKIVEKVVDRPVEVIRTVERRVDVPAVLTKEQVEATEYLKQRNDAYLREVGSGSTALLPVLEKKIKVYVFLDDVLKRSISEGSVRARVEAVLRRNGFIILPEDSKDFANTIINAGIYRADAESLTEISGSIGLTVYQYAIISGGGIQKHAWLSPVRYDNPLHFGSANFYMLPAKFEEYATQASNDLLKAGQLPYSK
jgi:hypothetical protein